MELWCRGLTCLPVTQEIAGSNPVSSAIYISTPSRDHISLLYLSIMIDF